MEGALRSGAKTHTHSQEASSLSDHGSACKDFESNTEGHIENFLCLHLLLEVT